MEAIELWYDKRCIVKGMEFSIILKSISRVTWIPNEGILVKREGKVKKLEARDRFFQKVMKSKKLYKY